MKLKKLKGSSYAEARVSGVRVQRERNSFHKRCEMLDAYVRCWHLECVRKRVRVEPGFRGRIVGGIRRAEWIGMQQKQFHKSG